MLHKKIKIVQYGCNERGRDTLQVFYESGAEIVGAIDSNPKLVGMDIGDFAHLGTKLGIKILPDNPEVLQSFDADTIIVSSIR